MDVIVDVPDSTDWLNTSLSEFAPLENVLHCEICKEFYDTPMITSCSHTFCSKCIRTSLSSDGRCPACRATDQANKLRNNYAVQEVVRLFLSARPHAIAVAREERAEEEQAARRSTKRKRAVSDSDDVEQGAPEGRITRRKSRRIAASQTSEADVMVIDSNDDEDYKDQAEVNDGLVECLLGCGKRMKVEEMDSHLDRCEAEQKAASQTKSRNQFGRAANTRPTSSLSNPAPKERLAELNYSMMNQNALCKKLKDIGIPSQGGKPLMVKRHIEWVNLWNANCDSNNPRSKSDLLRDLDIWERTQGGRAPNASTFTNSFKQKDFDGASWASKNKDDFSRLIADARRKKSNPATEIQNHAKKNETATSTSPKAVPQDQEPAPPMISKSESSPASYANNPEAIASVRQKVEAVNAGREIEPVMNAGFRLSQRESTSSVPSILSERSMSLPVSCSPLRGPQNPALLDKARGSPQRRSMCGDEHTGHTRNGSTCSIASHMMEDESPKKVPMFAVPEKPVSDVDDGGQTVS